MCGMQFTTWFPLLCVLSYKGLVFLHATEPKPGWHDFVSARHAKAVYNSSSKSQLQARQHCTSPHSTHMNFINNTPHFEPCSIYSATSNPAKNGELVTLEETNRYKSTQMQRKMRLTTFKKGSRKENKGGVSFLWGFRFKKERKKKKRKKTVES